MHVLRCMGHFPPSSTPLEKLNGGNSIAQSASIVPMSMADCGVFLCSGRALFLYFWLICGFYSHERVGWVWVNEHAEGRDKIRSMHEHGERAGTGTRFMPSHLHPELHILYARLHAALHSTATVQLNKRVLTATVLLVCGCRCVHISYRKVTGKQRQR